ncbi:MAG: BLUF domain-containing protein [Pseudomonadota bacterium]
MPQIHGIAYTSVAYPISDSELTALLERARDFNARVGVTGVLFHHAGRFFQYFEGDEEAVRRVRDRIIVSTRHHSLHFLYDDLQSERVFPSWYMGFCEPPANVFQAVANAEWSRAMPITRTSLRRSEALSLVLSYWSRWVADRPDKARSDPEPMV